MDMRFGTWDVGSMYRAGSLKTAASESAKSDVRRVVVSQPMFIHFSMEKKMLIIIYGNAFLYIRESYKKLRE
jgi:hypothetical protein